MTPPGRVSAIALSSSWRLQLDERGEIARPLGPGDVGMAADGAGRGAGRVDQRRVEGRRVEGERVGDDDLGMKPQPLEIGGEHFQPLGRAVDRRDAAPAAASSALLPPGAAQRSTTRMPGARVEQPRRQRGGGVLHPPFALRVAFELGDGRMGVEPHRAGRQHDPAEPLRPALGVALDAEVERRLGSDARRRSRAPSPRRRSRASAPRARAACRRRADRRRRGSPRARARSPRSTALTRPANGALAGLRPRRPHREIDGGMVGRVEEEDLRRADDQRPFEHAAALRHALVEPLRERLADRAEPAERDGRDRARERRVARIEARVAQREVGGEALVERARPWSPPRRSRAPPRRGRSGPAAEARARAAGVRNIRAAVDPNAPRLESSRPSGASLYAIFRLACVRLSRRNAMSQRGVKNNSRATRSLRSLAATQ